MKNLISVLVAGVLLVPVALTHAAVISSINGLTASDQFLIATTTDPNLSFRITSSSPTTHLFNPIWSGILQPARGGTGTSSTPSNGQLLIGNGTDYTVANLIQGSNVVITNATGSITIAITSNPSFASLTLTNPLAAIYGGTGTSTYAKGDLLVAVNSTTLSRLPTGQDGQILMVSSTAPLGIAWVTLTTSTPGKHFQVDTSGTLTTGLVSYFKLTSDASDFYGSNSLTNNNSISFDSNDGASFNGSNQYLSKSSPSGMATGTSVRSYSAWVKLTNSANRGVVSIGRDPAANENFKNFDFEFQSSTNMDMINEGNGSAGLSMTDALNSFHLVIVTWSGSQTEIFFDGSSIGTISGSLVPVDSSADLFAIGANIRKSGNGSIAQYFQGNIKEVGIWNKILSSTEIYNLYNGGNGQTMTQ